VHAQCLGMLPSGDAAQARSSAWCQVSARPMSVYMHAWTHERLADCRQSCATVCMSAHAAVARMRGSRARLQGAGLRTSMCGARCVAPVAPFAIMAMGTRRAPAPLYGKARVR